MKGIVLSGGSGTRLRPITNTGPKQLIPVANRPVLDYVIDDLHEAGIDDIAVVLGNKGREEIREYLGPEFTYVVQGDPKGLAHAVACCEGFVGTDDFVVYLGDNILSEGIEPLIESFESGSSQAGIATQSVQDPTSFGVVEYENGSVANLVEKPENPPSNHALVGVYAFTPRVFDAIETLEPSWRGEYEITHAIQWLLDNRHRVESVQVNGWWKDTGTPEDILKANRLILDRDGSRVHPDAEIDNSQIVEPVNIDEDVRISDSKVGPYASVGPGTTIEHSIISHSIVIGNSRIKGADRMKKSLIGENTEISQNLHLQFVLGRDSTLGL